MVNEVGIRKLWRKMHGAKLDGPNACYCPTCGYRLHGDEPALAVPCWSCFKKASRLSVAKVKGVFRPPRRENTPFQRLSAAKLIVSRHSRAAGQSADRERAAP